MCLIQQDCLIGGGKMSRLFGTGLNYTQEYIDDDPDKGSAAYTDFGEYLNELGIISQIKRLGDAGFIRQYAVPDNLVDFPEERLKSGSLYLVRGLKQGEKNRYYIFYVNPLDWDSPDSYDNNKTIGAFYIEIHFLTKWAKGDSIGFERGGWQSMESEIGLVKPNHSSYFGNNHFMFYHLPEGENVGLFNWVGF